jgi:hypothetical protein
MYVKNETKQSSIIINRTRINKSVKYNYGCLNYGWLLYISYSAGGLLIRTCRHWVVL